MRCIGATNMVPRSSRARARLQTEQGGGQRVALVRLQRHHARGVQRAGLGGEVLDLDRRHAGQRAAPTCARSASARCAINSFRCVRVGLPGSAFRSFQGVRRVEVGDEERVDLQRGPPASAAAKPADRAGG